MPTCLRVALLLAATAVLCDARSVAAQWEGGRRIAVTGGLGMEGGLSAPAVTSLALDRAGFLWVGTADGLNRYEGYGVHVYHADDGARGRPSIPDDFVSLGAMHQDPRGLLWFGTQAGLARYDPATDRFEQIRQGPRAQCRLGDGFIESVRHVRRLGALVVGTREGVYRYRPSDRCFERLPSDGETGERVFALFEDRAGALWLGTDRGLALFNPARGRIEGGRSYRLRPAATADLLARARVHDIAEGADGSLWVGTIGEGLFRLDPARRRVERYAHAAHDPGSLPEDRVLAVHVDRRGWVWVGTYGGGLAFLRTRAGPFEVLGSRAGDQTALPDARVTSFAEEPDGTLWVGTWRGVSRVDVLPPFRFIMPNPARADALQGAEVSAVTQDEAGVLWVGTEGGGLHRVDPVTGAIRPLRLGLPEERITALWSDGRRDLWIGTQDGVSRLDRAALEVERFRHDDRAPGSLAVDLVYSVLGDGEGSVWIGTDGGGLDRFDVARGVFDHFPPGGSRGPGGAAVWPLLLDPPGGLWLGSVGGGLDRYDPRTNTFRHFRHAPADPTSLSHDRIISLSAAAGGRLWVGTMGGGLNLFDPRTGRGRRYSVGEGLPNHNVACIMPVDRDIVWVSTSDGLVRLDARSGYVRRYGTEDGLPSANFRFGSCLRGGDGALYFGSYNGLVAFHPDSLREERVPPSVVLTRAEVLGVPIPLSPTGGGPPLRLRHWENVVAFEFAALDLTAPARNQYAYMMEGVDQGWTMAGGRRSAAYSNLAPGTYAFRVRAAGSMGIWNNEGVVARLVISPPWWRTAWFLGLSALVVAGAVATAYRLRVKRLLDASMREVREEMRIEGVRRGIAADLHDTIGSGISSIALDVEVQAKLGRPPTPERLLEFAGRMRAMVEAVRETIWLAGTEHDYLRDVVERLRADTDALLRDRVHRFEGPDPIPDVTVGPQERRHVTGAVRELLHNVHRYSGAANVDVRVHYDPAFGTLTIEVEDDGVGFDVEQALDARRGLHALVERVETADGRVVLDAAPGRGSRIAFSYPIGHRPAPAGRENADGGGGRWRRAMRFGRRRRAGEP